MKVRRTWTLGAAVLAALIAVTAADSHAAERTEKKSESHEWLTEHQTIQNLLRLHNEERARYGLPALTLNPRMCLLAQQHAVWMAQTGIYQHSSLGMMEIIFYGPRNAAEAVAGWIASPAHHQLMLSGREAGFGYMQIDGRCYWVGVFR